jgi:glyoxylate reductase
MNVLVTGNLPEHILALIRAEHAIEVNTTDRPLTREQLLPAVADKHGLLTMLTDRVDEELLDRAPDLTIVANCAVGYDNIDVAAATQRRIMVTNTPGVLTDSTADVAFALMLAVARRVVEGDRRVRQGKFKHFAPFHFLGQDISGKTLGIIGMGRIGQAVAKRAAGFDMRMIYISRHRLSAEAEAAIGARYADFETVLRESDILSVHVPLTPQTRHLLGADQLRLMKPSAILINTARGPVIEETALVTALHEGWIGGAGLDVYENEPNLTPGLAECDNAVLLPHVGSATIETRTRMARLATENLLAGLRGAAPPNCLNRALFDK